MSEDISEYLRRLDESEKRLNQRSQEKEKEEIRQNSMMAGSNSWFWKRNLEFFRENFRQAHELAETIESKVENWRMSDKAYETRRKDYYSSDTEYFWFYLGLERSDEYDCGRQLKIDVRVDKIRDRTPDMPECVTEEEIEANSEDLPHLSHLWCEWKDNERDAGWWINELENSELELEIRYLNSLNFEKECIKKKVKAGFLYEKGLPKIIEEIFTLVNDGNISEREWKDKIDTILPEGDYVLQRGNATRCDDDDNNITHAEDPNLKNG
jgi:hypothetical protein